VGNVTSIADDLAPSASRSFTYQDQQYFLTQATGPWETLLWTYDKIGDRLTETQTGEPLPFTYTYAGTTPKLLQIQPRPRANGSGSVTYGYDAAGNETSRVSSGLEGSGVTTSFTYSAENKLSQLAATPGLASTDLLYDGRGFLRDALLTSSGSSDFEHTEPTYGSEGLLYSRRWRRQSTYGTPQDNAPAPTITDDQTTHVFYFAGRPVAQWSTASGLTYLTTDHLGTPVLATDTSGTMLWQGGFTPFGAPYQLIDPSLFLRLPGQWTDSSWSGYGEELYYNVNRWYVPGTGRYAIPDPAWGPSHLGEINPFAYVGGRPIVRVDPVGLCVVAAGEHSFQVLVCCAKAQVNGNLVGYRHCYIKIGSRTLELQPSSAFGQGYVQNQRENARPGADCASTVGGCDLLACVRNAYQNYPNGGDYRPGGPNSNTFTATVARQCHLNTPASANNSESPGWDSNPPAAPSHPVPAPALPPPPGLCGKR
jgi:RHS repeat-associated protein